MGKDLTIRDRAVIGDCVRHFTFLENDLKSIGVHLDSLVNSEDSESVGESVSQIYLVLQSLKSITLFDFSQQLDCYFDSRKEEQLTP